MRAHPTALVAVSFTWKPLQYDPGRHVYSWKKSEDCIKDGTYMSRFCVPYTQIGHAPDVGTLPSQYVTPPEHCHPNMQLPQKTLTKSTSHKNEKQ